MCREVLAEHGLTGFPKTSGKRGIHINARVERGNGFTSTRRAALAFAREVERRMPGVATTAWWKEEREGVFLDYNQNARDRTVASAYSIRPMPDARVSTPLAWEEVAGVEAERFTLRTVPDRLREVGDPGAEESTHTSGPSTVSWPWPPRTRRADSATLPGRPTSPRATTNRCASTRRARSAPGHRRRTRARRPETQASPHTAPRRDRELAVDDATTDAVREIELVDATAGVQWDDLDLISIFQRASVLDVTDAVLLAHEVQVQIGRPDTTPRPGNGDPRRRGRPRSAPWSRHPPRSARPSDARRRWRGPSPRTWPPSPRRGASAGRRSRRRCPARFGDARDRGRDPRGRCRSHADLLDRAPRGHTLRRSPPESIASRSAVARSAPASALA